MINIKWRDPLEVGSRLSHFGIKGQHWGVRNGPPYPLDAKTSKRIKKGKNEKVRVSNEEYEKLRKKKHKNEDITKTSKYASQLVKTKGNFHEKDLREVVKIFKNEETKYVSVAEVLNENNERYIDRYNLIKKNKTLNITDDDLLMCNRGLTETIRKNELRPGDEYKTEIYMEHNPGVTNNCVKCTNTLEMRKRGYNVMAGLSENGMLNSATQYYWDGAVPYKEKYENIEARISGFGNKGSGEFIARRSDGSGHSVYFENVRQNDGSYQTIYRDGQIGKSYNSLSKLYEAEGFDKTQFSQITRLDNATPNFKHMGEDSVIRTVYDKEEYDSRRESRTGVLNVSTGKRQIGSDFNRDKWWEE